MTKNNKPVLIFDFDGTIADSLKSTLKILNRVAKEQGYDHCMLTMHMLKTRPLKELMKQFNVSIFKLPFLVSRIKQELKSQIPYIKPIPGLPEILKELCKKNYEMHIISSNSQENIELFLKTHHICYFESIFSATNIFGKHRVINNLIKKLGISKDQVIYIGDEIRDFKDRQLIS